MITLAVANLKGGTTKTTSSAFLLHALAESDLSVLGVDADPQGSLGRWAEQADWKIPIVGMPVANLHRQLPGVTGDQVTGQRYEAVVIDTPPLEDHRNIVMSALRLASHVICPLAPTPIEYERLALVHAAVADSADLRRDESPPEFAVLLTRTVPNAVSTQVYREAITTDGIRVLRGNVGRLERYALAYGDPVTKALNSAYGDALTELLDERVPA
jgi:chromosome partitioning protein